MPFSRTEMFFQSYGFMSLFPCCKQPQNTLLAVKDKKWGQGGVISEISRTISLKAALFNRTVFFPSLFLLLLFQEKKKGGGEESKVMTLPEVFTLSGFDLVQLACTER